MDFCVLCTMCSVVSDSPDQAWKNACHVAQVLGWDDEGESEPRYLTRDQFFLWAEALTVTKGPNTAADYLSALEWSIVVAMCRRDPAYSQNRESHTMTLFCRKMKYPILPYSVRSILPITRQTACSYLLTDRSIDMFYYGFQKSGLPHVTEDQVNWLACLHRGWERLK